jgi:hypothetical protein
MHVNQPRILLHGSKIIWFVYIYLWRDYIHKVSVTLHYNLQRQSRQLYGPPASVTT